MEMDGEKNNWKVRSHDFDCKTKNPQNVCNECEDEDIDTVGVSEDCYYAVGNFQPNKEPDYTKACECLRKPQR